MKKTITTFLLSDNPKGIKKVWIANRICSCIYLARNELKIAKERDELNQPSLYLLFGENKQVYVGETGDFNERIVKHNRDKGFWDEVLVFIAKDDSLSISEVKYLECLALEKIKKYTHYSLEENKQMPNFPKLEENKIEIVKEFFEEIVFLASFFNFSIFEPYEEKILFCKKEGIESKGLYDGNKFSVLKGSKIIKEAVSSYGNDSKKEKRNDILSKKAIQKDDYFVLKESIEFSSPSTASSFCLGNSSNGWKEWKNKSGTTMDEILPRSKALAL